MLLRVKAAANIGYLLGERTMKEIHFEVKGKTFLVITKEGEAELVVKGYTTPEDDENEHDIDIPNVLVVTRKNGDVLFVLEGTKIDSFKIITAQELYDKFRYQWFEPLADNYRHIIFFNDADYILDAYRIFSWGEIARFALVDRDSYHFYQNGEGDWKSSEYGGVGYLLVLINNFPYWTDAIGQIPFAVNTYRNQNNIRETIMIGMKWGSGTLFGDPDYKNEYDNYFILRGALFASKKFTYSVGKSERLYPVIKKIEHEDLTIPADTLGNTITEEEVKLYGVWNEKDKHD